VNDDKPRYVIDRVERAAKRFREPVIACLGLAFKANIDDLRESPALEIARALAERFAGQVVAVEPNIRKLPESLEGTVRLCELNEALAEADVVVILVDHAQFKRVDPVRLQAKVVIDTRGLLSHG
jgi:UDP-N-acetyl-D-mannosaminuronic acid dehydrogenase